MKVRATQLGYYDHRRRREGDVFHLFKEEDFSAKWMELLEEAAPKKKKAKKKASKKVEVEAEEEVSSDSEVI